MYICGVHIAVCRIAPLCKTCKSNVKPIGKLVTLEISQGRLGWMSFLRKHGGVSVFILTPFQDESNYKNNFQTHWPCSLSERRCLSCGWAPGSEMERGWGGPCRVQPSPRSGAQGLPQAGNGWWQPGKTPSSQPLSERWALGLASLELLSIFIESWDFPSTQVINM